MNMYEKYNELRDKELKLESLENEIKFYKSENLRIKKLIDEKVLLSEDYLLTKVLLDKQSPYLKSIIINKGYNHGVRLGVAVKTKSYFVGKVVGVNFLTSRVLLSSDLNSKIPVIVEPGSISAILSGNGNNRFGELEYLPKKNDVKNGDIVYTSGIDTFIAPAIPVGKVFIKEDKKFVNFFVDYDQLKFVKINRYGKH